MRDVCSGQFFLSRGIVLDDHDGHRIARYLLRNHLAKPAVSANDDVPLKLMNGLFHRGFSQILAQRSFDQHLRYNGKQIERGPDTGNDKPDRNRRPAGLSDFTSPNPTVEMVMTDM